MNQSTLPTREKVQRSVDRMYSLQTMYYTVEWLGNPVSAVVTKRNPIPNNRMKDLSSMALRMSPLIPTPLTPGEIPATFYITLQGLNRGLATAVPDDSNLRAYKSMFKPSNDLARQWLRNLIAREACRFEFQSTPFARVGGDETGDKVFE